MKMGKRRWGILIMLLIASSLSVALWPVKSPIIWTYPTVNSPFSIPAVAADGTIFVGDTRGNLVALNPNGTEKWKCHLSTGLIGEVSVGSDGTIYVPLFGSINNAGLASVSPAGQTNWIFRTTQPVTTPPAIGDDGTIYFGSYDSNFYALNPDGTERWRFPTSAPIFEQPMTVAEGSNTLILSANRSYAFDSDGSVNWNHLKVGMVLDGYAFAPLQSRFASIRSKRTNTVQVDAEKILRKEPVFIALDRALKTNRMNYTINGSDRGANGRFPSVKGISGAGAMGKFLAVNGDGEIQAAFGDKSVTWRFQAGTSIGAQSPFPLTGISNPLATYERDIQIPTGINSYNSASEDAALIQLDTNGDELWRLELPASLQWRELLDIRQLPRNWKWRFGLRAYRGLLKPVVGPDGTVYVLSNQGLLAIRPPDK